MKALKILAITIAYLLVMSLYGNIWKADKAVVESREALKAGEISIAVQAANNAVLTNPNEPSYYRERAKALVAAGTGQDKETVELTKELALSDLNQSYNLNPNNIATVRNNLPVYYFLSIKDLTKPAKQENINKTFLKETLNYMEKVKSISPNDVGIYVLLAKYQKALGLESNYQNSIEKISKLRPDLLKWHPDLVSY